MSLRKDVKCGGIEEAKHYMQQKEIPQLFESMMTALMYKKPADHLNFLEECLSKAKNQPKVKWHTFINPLPPILKPEPHLQVQSQSQDVPSSPRELKPVYSPLPPIGSRSGSVHDRRSILQISGNGLDLPKVNAVVEEGGLLKESASKTESEKEESRKLATIEGKAEILAIEVMHGVEGEKSRVEEGESKETLEVMEGMEEENHNISTEVMDGVEQASQKVNVNENFENEVSKLVEEYENMTGDKNGDSLDGETTVDAPIIVEKDIKSNTGENGIIVEDVAIQNVEEKGVSFEDMAVFEKRAAFPHRPWYAEYTERYVDTSGIAGKPVIFVLGGPGSGKGTQCARIVEKFSFTHLSAGDLLRSEVLKGSDIGMKIDGIMKEGQLVPQDVTICLLKQAMVDCPDSKGYLIDGFPREIKQGEQFENEVTSPTMVLVYACDDEVLIQRLVERGKHSGRIDDNEETIKKRLALFHEKTAPVIEHYGGQVGDHGRKVCMIDANKSIDEVFTHTCEVIEYLVSTTATTDATNQNVEEKGISFEDEGVAERNTVLPHRPWYAEYTERYVDTSVIAGKPVIFVLGGPGSGKGTQCARIVQKFSFSHLSAGDLLRSEVLKGSDIGMKIDAIMKEGQLVPQDVTICLLKQAMVDCPESKGYLIDGFPREIKQGEQFENEVSPPALVLNYTCDDEVLVHRLMERGKHSGRIDDNEETIKKRLALFHEKTAPVIEHYGEKVRTIDSNQSIDEVFLGTCAVLEDLVASEEPSEAIVEDAIVAVEGDICGAEGQMSHLLKEDFRNTKFIFMAGYKGSGKEEYCTRIAGKYEYVVLSITQILADEEMKNTPRGRHISDTMLQGEIVSQDVILQLVGEAILSAGNMSIFIIDGFPRTVEEADLFENQISSADLFVYFTCPTEIIIERAVSENVPPELRVKEVESFQANLQPLIERYKERGIAHQISTSDTTEHIDEQLEEILCQFSEDKNMAQELAGANIIFVLGGPGSGKGTQCERIVAKYGFCHLSTGDLLREEVKKKSERADKLNAIMKEGKLVPQEVILELLRDKMIENKDCKGFLIDGFPRDIDQGVKFQATVGKCKCILYFECTNEVMTERLLGRAKTSGRADDNIDTIKLRLKTFEDQTKPVVEKFSDCVKKINAERPVDAIFSDVCTCLDAI